MLAFASLALVLSEAKKKDPKEPKEPKEPKFEIQSIINGNFGADVFGLFIGKEGSEYMTSKDINLKFGCNDLESTKVFPGATLLVEPGFEGRSVVEGYAIWCVSLRLPMTCAQCDLRGL